MFATVSKSQSKTATEMTAGRTIARPAQKLACQRAKKLFVTGANLDRVSCFAQAKQGEETWRQEKEKEQGA